MPNQPAPRMHPVFRGRSTSRFAVAGLFAGLMTALLGWQGGCDRSDSSGSAGFVPEERAAAPAGQEVLIQLNWYPEAEHGGVYAAEAADLYRAAGLDLRIRAGGPGTQVAPELATGRVQFAFANADDMVLFREQGVDAVAVLAALQNHPRCILVRADSGVDGFDDLGGMTFQRQAGRPFVTFLEKRGLLEGVRQVPYAGSIAAMVNDKQIAIQAYSFAEPLSAQQQGLEVRTLMLSDLGWNPYSSVLVTTGTLIRQDPELVRAVVEATQQGWQRYLHDPSGAHRAILAANSEGMTEEVLQFGYEGLKQLALPAEFPIITVGTMSDSRWEELVGQMSELGLVDPGTVRPEDCFTNEFLVKNLSENH